MKMCSINLRIHKLKMQKISIYDGDFPTTDTPHIYHVDEEEISPMCFMRKPQEYLDQSPRPRIKS